MRINELIEHAEFHQEEYGDSLWIFISKHYGELKKEHMGENPHESSDHNKLPFHHNGCMHMGFLAMIQEDPVPVLDKIVGAEQEKGSFFYQEPSSFQFVKGIFQPPKEA